MVDPLPLERGVRPRLKTSQTSIDRERRGYQSLFDFISPNSDRLDLDSYHSQIHRSLQRFRNRLHYDES